MTVATAKAPTTKQTALSVDVIKQYPGQLQVDCRVIVNIPGRFFPQLTGAEQAAFYPGEPVEFKERHKFGTHVKAWGAAHTGPGLRVICKSAWKYPFLRPPVAEVVNRYNAKHHPALHTMLHRQAEAATSSAQAAAAEELPASAQAVATEELCERSALVMCP